MVEAHCIKPVFTLDYTDFHPTVFHHLFSLVTRVFSKTREYRDSDIGRKFIAKIKGQLS